MKHRQERERVVAVARTWIGTRFHNNAGIKGLGVDCAHLLAEVYKEAGVLKLFDVPTYSPQWFLHRGEERFLEFVQSKAACEIGEAEAQMGDCVLYKLGRLYAHGAIIVEWPGEIIHAHMLSKGVICSGGRAADLHSRDARFFTMWD